MDEEMPLDYQINKELQAAKKDIKKRRSSFGRNMFSPPSPLPSNLENNEKPSNEDRTVSTNNFKENEKPIENMESRNISTKISQLNFYETKSENLLREYREWKQLLSVRSKRVITSKSDLADAKSGATVIDESSISDHLTNEHKTILFSKPDYSQFVQEVKKARELLILVDSEAKKAELCYQNLVEVAKEEARKKYAQIEKDFYSSVGTSDPKALIRSFLND